MEIILDLLAGLGQLKQGVLPPVIELFDFLVMMLLQFLELITLTACSFSSMIVKFFSRIAFSRNSLILSLIISACSKSDAWVASFSIILSCLLIRLTFSGRCPRGSIRRVFSRSSAWMKSACSSFCPSRRISSGARGIGWVAPRSSGLLLSRVGSSCWFINFRRACSFWGDDFGFCSGF